MRADHVKVPVRETFMLIQTVWVLIQNFFMKINLFHIIGTRFHDTSYCF